MLALALVLNQVVVLERLTTLLEEIAELDRGNSMGDGFIELLQDQHIVGGVAFLYNNVRLLMVR
jgi:hypothetical protein